MPSEQIHRNMVETDTINTTHIYMTAHFPGLVQTSKKIMGGVLCKLVLCFMMQQYLTAQLSGTCHSLSGFMMLNLWLSV